MAINEYEIDEDRVFALQRNSHYLKSPYYFFQRIFVKALQLSKMKCVPSEWLILALSTLQVKLSFLIVVQYFDWCVPNSSECVWHRFLTLQAWYRRSWAQPFNCELILSANSGPGGRCPSFLPTRFLSAPFFCCFIRPQATVVFLGIKEFAGEKGVVQQATAKQ